MSSTEPAVWVVVLDYNTGPVLSTCLESFLSVQSPPLTVLLVDNASSDGLAAREAARLPGIRYLRLEQNTGYCGGNNAGIDLALGGGAEFVLVVNPDTRVINPDFVAELVSAMRRHPDAGIVGPLVHFRVPGTLQRTSCRLPHLRNKLRGWATSRGRPEPERPVTDARVETLNGVCVLLRAAALRDVGAFDPTIFMYGEDWDLTMRMEKRGWGSYQIPVDSIVHLQKSDGYDFLSMTNFLLKRNAPYVLLKHGHRADACLVAVGGWFLSAARMLRMLLAGRAHESMRYARFLARLTRAHCMTFLGRTNHAAFGPPAVAWIKP